MHERGRASLDGLAIPLLAYAAASLLHHVHNAVYLDAYPNMPEWLSPAGVLAAWAGVNAAGLAGFLLLRRGDGIVGLATVALYGVLGFDGLAHYSRAPLAAHTLAMNLTIWLEVFTALLLVVAVGRAIAGRYGADKGGTHDR